MNTLVCPAHFRSFEGSVLFASFFFLFFYVVCLGSVYRAQSWLCFWIVHFRLALLLFLTFNYKTNQIIGIHVDFKIRILERFMDAERNFQQCFSYIVASTFLVINRTPLTYHKPHKVVSSGNQTQNFTIIDMLYCGCAFRMKSQNK